MPSRRRAVVYLILTGLLWSTSGLMIKLTSWQPLSILSGRSIVAAAVILLYLRKVDLRFTRLQILGAASYVGTQFLFISATKLTTAANAIFLQYTAPLYVLLLGYWLLKERPRRSDWIAMAAILVGMLLFLGEDLRVEGVTGNLMAIGSGVLLAILTLSLRGQKDGVPANTFLLGTVAGALLGLPSLLQESFALRDVGIIAYLGGFQMGVPLILYAAAMRQVQALEASLILTLEPIMNPIWVALVIAEVPGPLALLGAALVLGGVIVRAVIAARSTP